MCWTHAISIVLFVFLDFCSYKTDMDGYGSSHVENTDSGNKEATEDKEAPCTAAVKSVALRGPCFYDIHQ